MKCLLLILDSLTNISNIVSWFEEYNIPQNVQEILEKNGYDEKIEDLRILYDDISMNEEKLPNKEYLREILTEHLHIKRDKDLRLLTNAIWNTFSKPRN